MTFKLRGIEEDGPQSITHNGEVFMVTAREFEGGEELKIYNGQGKKPDNDAAECIKALYWHNFDMVFETTGKGTAVRTFQHPCYLNRN